MKKLWLIVIIPLFGILTIGGYAVFDNVFPKADSINCPTIERVISITLVGDNDTSATAEMSDFGEFLVNIGNAQPTRKMSVNDYPTVRPYYSIALDTSDREYRYFVYVENAQTYIEIPYKGVYKANEQILTLISKYFNN